MSIKEIKYKLYAKGLNQNVIEQYINQNFERLKEYEKKSEENIREKKSNQMDEIELKQYLYKKGYFDE